MTKLADGAREGDEILFRLFEPGNTPPVDLKIGQNRSVRFETDGISVVSEISLDDPEPQGPYALGESGMAMVVVRNHRQVHKVKLQRRFRNPVVLLHASSADEGDPVALRLQRTGADWFEFSVQADQSRNGKAFQQQVAYLVVEEGTHRLGDGTLLQAGLIDASDRSTQVTFDLPFPSRPVFFSEVLSDGTDDAVVARPEDVSRFAFQLFLQAPDASKRFRASRKVGWMAITNLKNAWMPYEVGRLSKLDQKWKTLRFTGRFGANVVFLAGMQTSASEDLPRLQSTSLSREGVRLRLLPERGSRKGAKEEIGYLVVAQGIFSATNALAAQWQEEMRDVLSEPSSPGATVEEDAGDGLPRVTALRGNYPNPFSGQTSIVYELARETSVRLVIFDVMGREVARLVDEHRPAGRYTVEFDASRLSSGLYLCRMETDASTHTVTLVSVR